jgi:hypothetical protein
MTTATVPPRPGIGRLPRWAALAAFAAIYTSALPAEPVPPRSGTINIKTAYGAKGDGVTDDTGAIIQAIRDHIAERDHIIYFPAGVYLVSAPLQWRDAQGNWCAYLSFQGESRDTTTIRLRNQAPGYGNPATPRAVIYTASNVGSANPTGSGNEGFRNNISDLTIDTGKGNPGAIGIDYMAHNQARIADVTIQSGDGQGAVGLNLARKWIGPLLASNLTIAGFDLGISVVDCMSGATLEHVTLRNQRVAGLRNSDNLVWIRDLTSVNSVPAVQNVSWAGQIVLIDANLTGGATSVSAVQNTAGVLYARNVTSRGYASAISNGRSAVPGVSQAEFASTGNQAQPAGVPASLKLAVKETPQFADSDWKRWANAADFGAKPNDSGDDAPAIQAAIDSGRSTVYLPPGDYRLGDTLRLHGSVRRVIGYGARLNPLSATVAASKPAIRMESTGVPFVVVERLAVTANYSLTGAPAFSSVVEHTSSGVLVLKDIMDMTYKGLPGAGDVYLEDVCCGPFEFNGQNAWARQLDSETTQTHVRNIGGKLWVLGLKTEQISTILETTKAGQTEILGAFLSIWQNVTTVPAFINDESEHSLVFATGTDYSFRTAVRQTRNGSTVSIPSEALERRYRGTNVPLYSDRPQRNSPQPKAPALRR